MPETNLIPLRSTKDEGNEHHCAEQSAGRTVAMLSYIRSGALKQVNTHTMN